MEEEKNKPSLTLQELQQFFEERKGVINISPVAEEAGLSDHHLREMLKGERTLTQKSIKKLLPVLQRHGYQYTIEETSESFFTLEKLRQFFEDREKSINMSPLGEEAGLSRSYLNKIISGTRGLSKKTVIKLFPVLYKYGFQK